jgi:hypothetical protein
MTISQCWMCKADVQWNWEEAFDKLGFRDGDGLVETQTVADALMDAGYEVVVEEWGDTIPLLPKSHNWLRLL